MSGKKRGNTVEIVTRLAQPIAQELGLLLWDVRFVKEGAGWFLRIFIDKPEGVGIEDCEAMSRAINPVLDEHDPIEQSYCLEVCSPGIDRELTRPEHFNAYLGERIRVRLIRPLEDGRKEFNGRLTAYQDSAVSICLDEGEEIILNKKDAASIRLLDEDFVED